MAAQKVSCALLTFQLATPLWKHEAQIMLYARRRRMQKRRYTIDKTLKSEEATGTALYSEVITISYVVYSRGPIDISCQNAKWD